MFFKFQKKKKVPLGPFLPQTPDPQTVLCDPKPSLSRSKVPRRNQMEEKEEEVSTGQHNTHHDYHDSCTAHSTARS